MKTMQELKELQDLKNKMFPPKLEFGCVIEFKDENKRHIFTEKYWKVVAVDNKNVVAKPYLDDLNIDNNLESVDIKYVKILGKPLTILDILIMLECQRPLCKMKHDLDTKGYLTTYHLMGRDGYVPVGQIELDLLKPKINEQPKVTIIQLNKMLCK